LVTAAFAYLASCHTLDALTRASLRFGAFG
jgi:hypothetical protein